MPDALIELLRVGQHLATVDGRRYVAVHLVYECPQDGAPSFYCRYGEWASTPAARMAERDRQLAELADLLEQTQQQAVEAERHVQRLCEEKAELEKIITELPAAPAEAPKHYRSQDKRIECAICRRKIWPGRFDKHMQKHTRIDVPPPAEPIEPPTDDQIWRCAECRTNTFARSLRNPDYCQRCARSHPIAALSGQLAA